MGLYLDVETTYQGELTVIGLHHAALGTVQLVGPEITRKNLEAALPPAICIYTFDGERNDLQIIREQVGVDLECHFQSVDLLHLCHQANLHGGLKRIEERLGITRKLSGLSGRDAVHLWYTYQKTGDTEALETLLAYNREDVENLAILRDRLEARLSRC